MRCELCGYSLPSDTRRLCEYCSKRLKNALEVAIRYATIEELLEINAVLTKAEALRGLRLRESEAVNVYAY